MKTVIVYFDESKKAPEYAIDDPKANVFWPGHPNCPFGLGEKDENWIPVAGKAGWIAIHHDIKILTKNIQWDLVRKFRVSMVVIRGAGNAKLAIIDALLRPEWNKLHLYHHRLQRPWLSLITYDGKVAKYELYNHERIARDDWGRKTRPKPILMDTNQETQELL